ncbi:cytochrome c [Pelagicoccus sp. SDUM812005]|uniref:c-type cytochrome n=1 Tax=Pelagicoccus sp. SDUM812005 TaxID=3041257 RepID=UPI00280E4B90|nr:cytochrome c [Pelagicoccus sp. SDUM812005]MDQ8182398.1 cytochrome c [Pelagicoccus sp. SDUM812005]
MKLLSQAIAGACLAASFGFSSACANPPADAPVQLDPASVEKGKQTYAMFCQACHGPEDPSIDSPSNLFDKKWFHGSGRDGVEKTIRDGIVDKGMPGWGPMIPSEDIDALLDYLFSFQTTETSTDE